MTIWTPSECSASPEYHANPTMSSTDKVLRTPELLELVLLELPLRTLLTRASLVSKQWRDHIISSPPLQRALFFKTCPPGTPSRINPLLAVEFRIFFNDRDYYMSGFDKLPFAAPKIGSPAKRLSVTPGSDIGGTKDNSSGHSGVLNDGDAMQAPPTPPDHITLRTAFLRPSASWRRMLPRQPAVGEPVFWHYLQVRAHRYVGDLSVSCRGNMSFDDFDRVTFHEDPASVGFGSECWTMGALYDSAIQVCSGSRRSFRVIWDVQAHIRREVKMLAEAAEQGSFIGLGPNVRIAEAKVHVWNHKGSVFDEDTPKENISVEDTSDEEPLEEDMPDVMSLVDALGGREVVFQIIAHGNPCHIIGRGGVRPNYRTEDENFMRYYSFPAANLDADGEEPF
ncbi:hypothetical protein F5X68DRAFT_217962, partial [Plectosphaerella plurivora]